MKKRYKWLLAGMISISLLSAYKPAAPEVNGNSGLFMTCEDFTAHKLTYAFDCTDRKNKLRLNDLFGPAAGYIICNGEKHAFDKNRVFGYQICGRSCYRFYNGASYQIMDTAGFYLYYRYVQEEYTKGKEPIKTDRYFFSVNGGDAIQLLTIENVKRSFLMNDKFYYSIDEHFRNDRDLLAYDHLRGGYTIKALYRNSLK